MNIKLKDYSGWLVATLLAGVWLGSGFKQASSDFATIDLGQASEKSKAGISATAMVKAQEQRRSDLLKFLDSNRVASADQLQTLVTLSTEDNPSDADKAKINSTMADVTAASKRLDDLRKQATLTPEDRTALDDYAAKSQNTTSALSGIYQQFTQDVQALSDKQKLAVLDKARAAAKKVAGDQKLSVVFDVSAAPYGAKDITDATVQQMDATP